MNHYDALLAELRTVDKKLLRKLDRKRSPPEPMPHQIWYGSEIPPEQVDLFITRGGFPCIEGTPMVLGCYQYMNSPAVLYTTVALYAVNLNYDFTGRRYDWEKVRFPLRYADFREIRSQKDRFGFFSNDIAITRKDGSPDVMHGFIGLVHMTCSLAICVEYVNKHGPVEADPPVFNSMAEKTLKDISRQYFPIPDKPLFPAYIPLAPELPKPMEETKSTPKGPGVYPKESMEKMEQFRKHAQAGEPAEALEQLSKAAAMGHGDALWILGKFMENSNPMDAFQFYSKAFQAGSQEGAASLEILGIATAMYIMEHNDTATLQKILSIVESTGGVQALLLKAEIYLRGYGDIPRDLERGLQYLREAANKGSTEAMYQLGLALLADGVPEHRPAAREWILKAAANGSEKAMGALIHSDIARKLGAQSTVWDWGLQFYSRMQTPEDKAAVATNMLPWATTPKEHALWQSIMQCNQKK